MKFANTIRTLITQGISINKIRRITGAAKSTIYHHYKRLKGKKTKALTFKFKNDNELGEFLGIFAGDGNCFVRDDYHYTVRICLGAYEVGYRLYMEKQLQKWFTRKPQVFYTRYKGKPSGYTYWYYSKALYTLLRTYLLWEGKKTYTVRLKNLTLSKKQFNIGFLRGLIDTDGNFYKPKNRVSYSTVSALLAQQAHKIMTINCKVNPHHQILKKVGKADLHTLTVHGKEATNLLETVKPNNPLKAPVV